ncbi:MAG: helix-turn-helix transcriptional regulator [Lewinellaceae bacterium]|nr:helix-turn-helix transcriptional regulator [Lewinellaceae bacterium]
MGKLITWANADYTDTIDGVEDTTSLIYAADVYRYKKFRSAYSVKFTIKGMLPYLKEGQAVEVRKGQYFLVNRGSELECIPCAPGGEMLFVNFSAGLLNDVRRNDSDTLTALLDDPGKDSEAIDFFEYVYPASPAFTVFLQEVAAHMKSRGCSADDLSPDIFFEISKHLFATQSGVKRQIEGIHAAAPATREELYRRVLLAKSYMEDHWRAALNHRDVARFACLSPYHFHRTFREAFGVSPMRWFRRLKLQKAGEMLRRGRHTVHEVALHCGFGDIATFSKAFRREMGVSPSQAGSIGAVDLK